jgi:hypothetical protein
MTLDEYAIASFPHISEMLLFQIISRARSFAARKYKINAIAS